MPHAKVMIQIIYSVSGGYDYEFVDTVGEKYYCRICECVLRDARLTECCGQHYCDSCLEKWLQVKGKNICPYCSQENFKNKALIREINGFRIRCTNHKKGCRWVGSLGVLKVHLESNEGCDYVEVSCDLYGYATRITPTDCIPVKTKEACRKRVERRNLADHQKECIYRPFICEYCGFVDIYDAIAGTGLIWRDKRIFFHGNHHRYCHHYPLECPNKCGEWIKCRSEGSHRRLCPLEPLDCPFKSVGCTDKILQKDLDNHTQLNTPGHLLLLHQKLAQIHDKLAHTIRELAHKLEELVRKMKN